MGSLLLAFQNAASAEAFIARLNTFVAHEFKASFF
jgi:hypothetical protein